MQPIFVYQPTLLGILIASLLVWRVIEASIDIRSLKRLRAGAKRESNENEGWSG